MDKRLKHQQIVQELLDELCAYFPDDSYVELLPIVDEKNGQYLVYSDGWENRRRDYACFFHVEVKSDGKVYLRHDGTDLDIGNELVRKGIDKQDIVLAFMSPFRRELSDFAVA